MRTRQRCASARGNSGPALVSHVKDQPPMDLSAIVVIAIAACLLQVGAQSPYRQDVVVLNDACLPDEQLARRAADEDIANVLSGIASRLIGGSGKRAYVACIAVG